MRSLNPRTGQEMSPSETIIYDALCEAARDKMPCPSNLDLEMMIGCNSSSVAPTIVARLEARGLIEVLRWQRFRTVKICATGEWTMKASNHQTTSAHVPRGCGAGSRSGGKVLVR
ncbi:hypothetical protein [Novosphingobium sp. Leaf2]|uniref:hypothetical protein n=1 Tax=Novosphingobium sp. Leaf2 TaxID=1735670 RepID=UPI0006F9F26C|nr:hypothetical protein [Novosphingobium sp. Leaf2]KQM18392.1 hypothetical protein ASE49_09280 [Novosphingobium sp. Leaf2]